nr:unnamed protein product [Callosobruchus analis]
MNPQKSPSKLSKSSLATLLSEKTQKLPSLVPPVLQQVGKLAAGVASVSTEFLGSGSATEPDEQSPEAFDSNSSTQITDISKESVTVQYRTEGFSYEIQECSFLRLVLKHYDLIMTKSPRIYVLKNLEVVFLSKKNYYICFKFWLNHG